jgi:hypothetical protein
MSNHKVVIDLCSSPEPEAMVPEMDQPEEKKLDNLIFKIVKEFTQHLCAICETFNQLVDSGHDESEVREELEERDFLPFLVTLSRNAQKLGHYISKDSKWADEKGMEYLRRVRCRKNGAQAAFPVGNSGWYIVLLLLDFDNGGKDIIEKVQTDHLKNYMAFSTVFVHNPDLFADSDDSNATDSDSSDEDEKTKKRKINTTKWTSVPGGCIDKPKKKPNSSTGRGAKKQTADAAELKSEVKFCKKRKGIKGNLLPRAGTFNSEHWGLNPQNAKDAQERSHATWNLLDDTATEEFIADNSDDDWAVTKGDDYIITKRGKLV